MCSFCHEFDEERTSESRIIWENEDFLVLPTVGCLRPGYCLFMPYEHTKSFASLAVNEIKQAFALVETHRQNLESIFGETIIAEHGSGGYAQKGASCCDHAHLHLIPMPNQIEAVYEIYEAVGGKPMEIKTVDELAKLKNQPYMLLSLQPGDNFSRQFIRQVVAKLIGIENKYDWREHRFAENMAVTQDIFCKIAA
jgi:diadenosine tetraphosphate (Ap4A) HIT family hydrolase